MRKKLITILAFFIFFTALYATSFHNRNNDGSIEVPEFNSLSAKNHLMDSGVLADTINSVISQYSGEIGVAVIINSADTLAINNESKYPMMSVFKLHQSIALCKSDHTSCISTDTVFTINRKTLDADTWSPMLKDYASPHFAISCRDLLRYALILSDNNASNFMFENILDVASTDSIIATVIPRSSFGITYTEKEMKEDHSRAYRNYSSPLGAAILINSLFTEKILDQENQHFIKSSLIECKTGNDRIPAPLRGEEGVVVAHKTGSGYRNNNGELVAFNDVAFITLPDGKYYSIAVFIKDFKGEDNEAALILARISSIVYNYIKSF